jgi:glutamyl/glutaminyl-tRNA synthetase
MARWFFRFEDTDKERSQTAFEEPMIRVFTRLRVGTGMKVHIDNQSALIYIEKYLHQLVEEGKAYLAEDKRTGKQVR